MSAEEVRVTADGSPRKEPRVRLADDKWGCAYPGCLERARIITEGRAGSAGACVSHTRYAKELARG